MLKLFLFCLLVSFGFGKLVGEASDLTSHEDSDSEFYSYLVDESLRRLNFESKDTNHWKLDKVLSSSKQVVNGIKYQLSFVAVQTECNKKVSCINIEFSKYRISF